METPPTPEPPKPNWPLFFVCLLGPAVGTTIAAVMGVGALALAGLCASIVAPFCCAWMLAQRLRGPYISFPTIFLCLAVFLVPLSVGLCFGGCVLGAKFPE